MKILGFVLLLLILLFLIVSYSHERYPYQDRSIDFETWLAILLVLVLLATESQFIAFFHPLQFFSVVFAWCLWLGSAYLMKDLKGGDDSGLGTFLSIPCFLVAGLSALMSAGGITGLWSGNLKKVFVMSLIGSGLYFFFIVMWKIRIIPNYSVAVTISFVVLTVWVVSSWNILRKWAGISKSINKNSQPIS